MLTVPADLLSLVPVDVLLVAADLLTVLADLLTSGPAQLTQVASQAFRNNHLTSCPP